MEAAAITRSIREAAADLLGRGVVDAVLGYSAGWRDEAATPCVVTRVEDVDQLVFGAQCTHNLAKYLVGPDGWLTAPYRAAQRKRPLAVVARPATMRALTGLLQEHQFERADVIILGITDGLPVGVEPDIQVGVIPEDAARNARIQQQLAELEAMTPEERWAWWEAQYARCIRCYACRQVCPFCYCEQCIADENQPQWIERSSSVTNNRMWNTIRVFHLIGRCVDCGECERVCPADIPLGVLHAKMRLEVEEAFGYVAGIDVDALPALLQVNAADPDRPAKR